MDGSGKLVLLTGGNAGIGLEACKILSGRGYTVVASVRSDEKGGDMIAQVKEKFPNADINYLLCEMSDPNSIKSFAEEFKTKWLKDGRKLDFLINNAGATFNYPEMQSAEVNPKWEKTMVVNALAPIYLTDLLIDSLKETAAEKGEARVLMVNSSITTDYEWYNKFTVDFDDLMYQKPGSYENGSQTYKLSKMVLMMATLAMVDELDGTNVRINSMCPGPIVGTNLFSTNTQQEMIGKLKCILCCVKCFTGNKSNHDGGQYIVDIVDTPKGATNGVFYVRGAVRPPHVQVAVKENQKLMLQTLREMGNSVA
ncbi:uncharacterized protein [Watersipora subatra]|uniref:uncharacterized protein n=1 Tax=Watersipora subatra TaxID=2589382 RepID=UPI00355B699E